MAFENNSEIENFIKEVRGDIEKAIGRLESAMKATRNTVAERKFKVFKNLLQEALNKEAGVKREKMLLKYSTCPTCNQPLGDGTMVSWDAAGNGKCMTCQTPVT